MSVGFSVDLDDDGSGTTGTIHNAAWKAAMAAAIDALVGNWIAVPFNAARFTGSGSMIWTVDAGDVSRNRYQIINKTMRWQVTIATSSVGGTPNTLLQVTIPTGAFSDAASRSYDAVIVDNGVVAAARVQVVSGSILGVSRRDGAAFAASINNTSIEFAVEFELA